MNKVIGIDVGGSTTKVVGICNNEIFSPLLVKADDPLASVYGALGKFLNMNNLTLPDIEKIMLTGVGSSPLKDVIHGIPAIKVDEFKAIGLGGLYLSGLKEAIVVSMGTGTAIVKASGNDVVHIGGTGIGGGTLLGLSYKMLNIRNFNDLVTIAEQGNLSNVDLTIGDVHTNNLDGFLAETTMSNFGKLNDLASKEDIALGIINLVLQSIGMLAVFATNICSIKDIVLTGNLSKIPQARSIFNLFETMFPVKFHIPNHSEFVTAIGAAITK